MGVLEDANDVPSADWLTGDEFVCDGVEAGESGLASADERVRRYVESALPSFERLRDSAGQLAGLLVLRAAGGRWDGDHPMLAMAAEAHLEAREAALSLVAPRAAEHHYHHLVRAVRAIGSALAAARTGVSGPSTLDAVFLPLKAGYRELRHASRCLPGFVVVDLEQGCCAGHAGPRRARRLLDAAQ